MRLKGPPGSKARVSKGWPFLALVLASCTSVQVDQVEIAGSGADYFFWLALDEVGNPRRAGAVHGIVDRKISFGGDALFKLGDGEDRAIAVAFTREDLLRVHGGFLVERESELYASMGIAPNKPEIRERDATAALPAETMLLGEPASLETLRDNVRLDMPIDPEYCRLDSERLEPFAATAQALPDSGADLINQIKRVEILDRDRVLAMSDHRIFVAHRGQPFREPAFLSSSMPGEDAFFVGMVLGPEPASGPRTLYVAGLLGKFPALFELTLDGDAVQYTRTSTVIRSEQTSRQRFSDVLLDSRGYLIGVGEPDLLFVRAPGSELFENNIPREADPGSRYQRIIETNDPREPHLFSENRGFLFTGDAVESRYTKLDASGTLNALAFDALAATPDGSEIFGGGRFGALVSKKRDSGWVFEDELPLPPRFHVCARFDPGVPPTIGRNINGLSADDEALYIAISECNTLLRLQTHDRCMTVLPISEPIAVTNIAFVTVQVRNKMLVAGGSGGMLYTIDL